MTLIKGDYKIAISEAKIFLKTAELIASHANAMFKVDYEMGIGFKYAEFVNHSFAVELLLKAILLKENGSHQDIHDIKKLFYALSSDTRNKLNNLFSGEFYYKNLEEGFSPITISTLLKKVKEPFVEFRYHHQEKKKKNDAYSLDILPGLLMTYLTKDEEV